MIKITSELAHAIFAAIATTSLEGYVKVPIKLDFDINIATKTVVEELKALYPGIYNLYEPWIKT